MSNQTASICKSYAKALVHLSIDTQKKDHLQNRALKKLSTDMRTLVDILGLDPAVEKFLNSKLFSIPTKREFIKKLMKLESISPLTTKFILVVIEQGRSELLKEICYSVINYTEALSKIVTIYFQSSIDLTEREKKSILTLFTSHIDANQIRLICFVTPSLIAGFKIQIGSRQVDLSLKSRLNLMYKAFKLDPSEIWNYSFVWHNKYDS